MEAATVPLPAPAASPPAFSPEALAALPRSLALPVAGMAVFGFALRSTVERDLPGLQHLAWSALLPATLILAWLVCLPALFIFLVAREQQATLGLCARATLEALKIAGFGLASTAPMLWFFAVTAPHSHILQPLGLALTAFALMAGGSAFAGVFREAGVALSSRARLGHLALVALVFVRFATGSGLSWLS